jgi:hypothetical protein
MSDIMKRFSSLQFLRWYAGSHRSSAAAESADTLPSQYTDAEFWHFVNDFSEPGGDFQFENFVSNEVSYMDVLPDLTRMVKPGGAILASHRNRISRTWRRSPKVAFVLDIRRQNMLELLMYKALFEMSPNRVEFVSRLFSRQKPPGLPANPSAEQLFKAFDQMKGDPELYKQTFQAIKDRLKQHGFKPVGDDEEKSTTSSKCFSAADRGWITPTRVVPTTSFPATTI